MRIVCKQTILMKCHAFLVTFKKAAKFEIVCLLQIIGGALWVKTNYVHRKTFCTSVASLVYLYTF